MIWCVGCSNSAPNVTYCIPDLVGYACSDESIRAHSEMLDWTCLGPRDTERLLRACKLGWVAEVEFCIVISTGKEVICGDGYLRSVVNGSKWACLSPKDTERLLTYCKRMDDD